MKHLIWVAVLILMLAASSNLPDLVFDHFYPSPAPIETMAYTVDLELPQPSMISRETEPKDIWTVTGYCACEKCCPGTSDNLTANMSTPFEGVTVAADPSVPFGTRVWIDGVGERTVMDRGGAITGKQLDVYFSSHADAIRFGKQQLEVRIIE